MAGPGDRTQDLWLLSRTRYRLRYANRQQIIVTKFKNSAVHDQQQQVCQFYFSGVHVLWQKGSNAATIVGGNINNLYSDDMSCPHRQNNVLRLTVYKIL